MQFSGYSAGAIALAVAVSACGTHQQVNRATPLFDKAGVGLCRPEQEPVSAIFPARLPICEEICADPLNPLIGQVVICPAVVVPRAPVAGGNGSTSTGTQPGEPVEPGNGGNQNQNQDQSGQG
jgi:hypothetical protein